MKAKIFTAIILALANYCQAQPVIVTSQGLNWWGGGASGTPSMSLSSGNQLYVYGATTGGSSSMSAFANGQTVQITNGSGYISAELVATTNSSNSYTTGTSYDAFGGFGVSGFNFAQGFYGFNPGPGSNLQASVQFTLSAPALVAVVGMGSSQATLFFSGLNNPTVDVSEISGKYEPVLGIEHEYLGAGTYTIQETTGDGTNYIQTATHEVDLIGVFIFADQTNAAVSTNLPISLPSITATNSIPAQPILSAPATNSFTFQSALFGPLQTLSLNVVSVNPTNGAVTINGNDTRAPSTPFQWQWGDGSVTSGGFPQSHTYPNTTSNYVVTVTAFYNDGSTGTAQTVVWFKPPSVLPVTLPSDTIVTIATSPQTLATRFYSIPPLTNFSATNFGIIPRTTIEYVLTAAAAMERDFDDEDFFLFNGQFQQMVMCDPSSSGNMYSIWYSSPVAFGAAPDAFTGSLSWSSYFHEMGHNVTLNSPANYYLGGKIDGNANAIVSEALAQIFQHATGYELVNHGTELGLSPELVADIRNSALASISIVRSSYNDYTNSGSNFQSWNNPNTPQDETFDTFMTVAYKFFQHAEQGGQGYRIPLKRLMQALELFNSDWLNSFDPGEDTPAADSFRATLWVAAMSYAFQTDLRGEFGTLNFPVSDTTYSNLSSQMAALPDIINTPFQLNIQSLPGFGPSLSINGPTPRFYTFQSTTNLSNASWTNIGNVFNANTNSLWLDTSATNPTRFYRSVVLP